MEPGLVGGELVEDEMHTEGTPIFRQLFAVHPFTPWALSSTDLQDWRCGKVAENGKTVNL